MDNPILFSQNFDKITHHVQSKNKDQVFISQPRCLDETNTH
jgi:hypothetical protein